MARWQMTLKQSGGSPSPNIGTLTLKHWSGGEPPKRSQINHITLGDFSPVNIPTIGGSSYSKVYHFSWPVSVLLTDAEARKFDALVLWQQNQFAAGNDGRLILTEEVEYLPPETGTHSRTIVSGTTVVESWSQTTGFGTFYVFITLNDQHKVQAGWTPTTSSTGVNYKLIQFVATEM